ncbi:MAG: hypothetical protein LKF69_01105 [Bacilli bacterium]|jgi:hypothetical protein|nr:hypothetical protein [Bacilli bacterium]MCH4235388.1 hypothetical protein [Bacilli bacterium]
MTNDEPNSFIRHYIEKDQTKSDYSKIAIGMEVTHKAFGYGKIIDIFSDSLTIKFDKFDKEKMFEYPSSFENGFLMLMESIKSNSNDLVWYVCYGSNLCLERFMCYLTGKGSSKFNISANPRNICSDKTHPRDIKNTEIPYELYFAKLSSVWGGSVAFLDKDKQGKTYGRAYLISKAQYNHIKKCEGNWYKYEISLGEIDGIKTVTFTNKDRFIDISPVSIDYRRVMINGLEEMGVDKETAEDYLDSKIK